MERWFCWFSVVYNKVPPNSVFKTISIYSSNAFGLAGLGSAKYFLQGIVIVGSLTCSWNSMGWLDLLCSMSSHIEPVEPAIINVMTTEQRTTRNLTVSSPLCSESSILSRLPSLCWFNRVTWPRPKLRNRYQFFANIETMERRWVQEYANDWDHYHNPPKSKEGD